MERIDRKETKEKKTKKTKGRLHQTKLEQKNIENNNLYDACNECIYDACSNGNLFDFTLETNNWLEHRVLKQKPQILKDLISTIPTNWSIYHYTS